MHRASRGDCEENPKRRRVKIIESQTNLIKDRCILAANGYSIHKKIDSGTFATVRYAEKKTPKGLIPLAVKIIDKSKASPLFADKFLKRELEIWPRLRHRAIIQVERMFQIHDRIYVFMELAARGSIIDYLQNCGPVEESVARMWAKKMCQAVRYCHRKGVAHRDLKCDNLLLDEHFQVKIGDFGFCCRAGDPVTGALRLSDTYCGSSSYVAPEVLAGKPYDPISADVWSAGVCIFVILNNAMPFDDSSVTRMHEDQVARRYSFTPEAEKSVSPSARRLVRRMLEPDPARRPAIENVLSSCWMRMR